MHESSFAEGLCLDRSDEDMAVWSTLSQSVAKVARSSSWHTPVYTGALNALLDPHPQLPSLIDINDWLMSTGWKVEAVDGYVSAHQYHQMLSRRTFPVARAMRKWRDLEHSAAPDFAHDVLGHLPMLFDPDYRGLMLAWARRGLNCMGEPQDAAVSEALSNLIAARDRAILNQAEIADRTLCLEREHAKAVAVRSRRFLFDTFFTWVFEYGVLAERPGWLTLIGGAMLSSKAEMRRLFDGEVEIRSFDTGAVGHPVDYTICQPLIFSARSYSELYTVLASI